jgi:hypothetical protein
MKEPEKFYNRGFGWMCRRCEEEPRKDGPDSGRPRYLTEGEAEKQGLAATGRARWADSERNTLVCPVCGVSEALD